MLFEKKNFSIFYVYGNVLLIKKVEYKDNFIFNVKLFFVFNYFCNRFV